MCLMSFWKCIDASKRIMEQCFECYRGSIHGTDKLLGEVYVIVSV